uniref:Lipoyl-binding domain-containing protein n=1 Tax=Ditylenchus dipsaci TaxID=166011 RepID=A0A915CSK9_9BILA
MHFSHSHYNNSPGASEHFHLHSLAQSNIPSIAPKRAQLKLRAIIERAVEVSSGGADAALQMQLTLVQIPPRDDPHAYIENVLTSAAGEVKESIDGLLLRKGALSRCILAVSSRPISSRCSSLGALRTDSSKLCSKQSLLLSSLFVQHSGRIEFRLISTTLRSLARLWMLKGQLRRVDFRGDIRWIKQKGDFVNADELVAEIETDKTSVEVPAPFSGTIVELLIEDGNKVTAKQKIYKLEKGMVHRRLLSSQSDKRIEEEEKLKPRKLSQSSKSSRRNRSQKFLANCRLFQRCQANQ